MQPFVPNRFYSYKQCFYVVLVRARHRKSAVAAVSFIAEPNSNEEEEEEEENNEDNDDIFANARTYQSQLLQAGPSLQVVPQSELSNVSLDNLECILKVLWGPTSSNSSQMVELTPTTDLDYGEACNLFKLPGRKLHKIYRIQNTTLFIQYMTEKRKMDQKYSTQADSSVCKELYLYHGTDRRNVESINANGFDRSYSGVHDSGCYGQGAYFARDLGYSAYDYYSPVDITSGHKFVYVARVLVGRFCQGHINMKHLPNQESGIPFDSAVNNLTHPGEFVIFRDIRAYPTYLYEFS